MSRGVAAFVFAALASTLCASGGAAQRLSDDERREALQLCYSSDEAAQRFCLRRIADLAADDADARRALTHLARQPGPVGDDARVLHRLRYGGDLPTLAPSPTQRSAPAQAPTPPAEGYAPPPPYAPEPYAPQPYAPQPYAPQQYAPQQHAPEPYAPERYAPPVYPSSHRFAPRPRPNDPSRIHLTATGYTLEAEQRFFTFQGPAVYKVGAGLTDNFSIEATTIFPAAIVAALITLKYGLRLEYGGLVIFGGLGGIYSPTYGLDGGTGIFRGGVALSVGTPDTFLNLSAEVGGGFYRFAGLLPEEGGHLYSVLTGGFSARLGSTASIHAEGVLPGIYRDGSGAAGFGSFGLALWGFRFNAPHCAVDASLVYPLHEDLWRVYEIWPLGLPWLTVAFPF